MRIQAITNSIPQLTVPTNKKSNLASNFGLRMNEPINNDTISFGQSSKVSKVTKMAKRVLSQGADVTEKAVAEANDVSNKKAGYITINKPTARTIYNKNLMTMKAVDDFLYNTFGDLVAEAKHPENPIYDIICRPKSKKSIIEKTGSREWKSVSEVCEYMTDLKGGKIVLRDSSKQSVDRVLDRLIPDIRSKGIEILEIENKRPRAVKGKPEHEASKYDYASVGMIKKLIKIQNEVWKKGGVKDGVKIHYANQYTPANYSAIHMLLRIPGIQLGTFELQVMGYNTDIAKKIDDKIYKKLDGKMPDGCPQEFHELFEPLTNPKFYVHDSESRAKEIVKSAKDAYNKYRAQVFLHQRQKADMLYSKKNGKTKERFLPITEDIFPKDIVTRYNLSFVDYDYNNIAEILERTNKKSSWKRMWHYTIVPQ